MKDQKMQQTQTNSETLRDRFRDEARLLLHDADSIITGSERERRDLTNDENARIKAVFERARRLNAKAEGKPDTTALSQRTLLFRAIHALVQGNGNRTAALEIVRKHSMDPEVGLIIKATTPAASTSTASWAGELVAPALGEFIPLLRPQSALFALAPDPMPLTGTLRYPRAATGTPSGFIAEGSPIPVKAGSVEAGFDLTPKKACGIVVATGELIRRADRFAENYVLGTLSADIALGVDQVFLSNSAATAAAPAGIFHSDNAVAPIAATAGGTPAAVAADIAALLTAGANMVAPRLLINPATIAVAGGLTGSTDYASIQALLAGSIGPVQVIATGNLAVETLALIDVADLLVAGGDGFELDVSEHTTLHMDTAPAADLGASDPSPWVSMYQRDMAAVLVKLWITWHSKRKESVQHIANVSWA